MLINRDTAPEQSVKWTRSPKWPDESVRIFRNFKTFIKFANFNEFKTESHEFSNYGCQQSE